MHLRSLHKKDRDIQPKRLDNDTKKAEGLPLLSVGLGVWLCLPKTTSIIPQDAPFELKVMFCTKSRFTYYFVLYWVRERYEHSHYILPKEGHPKWATLIFIKRTIRIATICLGLQNALNISDNRSIYNYYGTNRVIIV